MAMNNISSGLLMRGSVQKPWSWPLPNEPFNHLKSSFSSTFKPLLKEWQQLPMRSQVAETLKNARLNLLDTFVESTFKFVEQPILTQGNFAPVEEIGEEVLVSNIEGDIPEDFPEGVYIRTGPNFLFPDKTEANSIFGRSSFIHVEGDGMLHATYFNRDNKGNWTLSYKNRYVEAETFTIQKERDTPLFLPAVEGQPMAVLASIALNLLRTGKINRDLNNTSVIEHAGNVYSVAENHLPYKINVTNLDTLNTWDVNGAWDRPFTSHPKIAPGTGEMVMMGVDAKKPYYVVGVISADGKKMVHKVDLKFERSTLVHEIGVTESYNVIMDYPLMVDLGRVINGGSFIFFERDRRAKMGVMPRYGDAESVTWFDVETHCTYHIINSFEDEDEVVVRGCRATGSFAPGPVHGTDKLQWFQRAFKNVNGDMEDFDPSMDGILFPRPYEWRLNMKDGTVTEGYLTRVTDLAMDYPTINNRFMGLKNKYGYGQGLDSETSSNAGAPLFKTLVKLSFNEFEGKGGAKERTEVEYHDLQENQFVSGMVFVEKPGAVDEDDGWIVSYVHDESSNVSQDPLQKEERVSDIDALKVV